MLQRLVLFAAFTPLVLILVAGANRPAVVEATAATKSTGIVVTPDGSRLLVANFDSGSVSIVDLSTLEVDERPVGSGPRSIAIDPSGLRALVTLQNEDALLSVMLSGQGPDVRVDLGPEPFAVLCGESGRIFVSVTGGARVDVLDSSLERIASIPTVPEPRGMALSSDETRLYVTHFLTGRVSVIDTSTFDVLKVISTGADSNLSENVVLDEERGFAWLPQTRSSSGNTALLFDTTLFPIVSAVDLSNGANDNRKRIALDIADRPVNMPTDAVLSSGGILWVVHAGSNDVSAIELATGFALTHVEVEDNPRAIALSPDESRVYVSNALAGSVSIIDASSYQVVGTIDVTTLPLPPDVLRGKILFHSSDLTALAKDQWISCAACHPDGRTDGRTWFFRDGPRSTPSLIGAGETGPWHWSGDLDELEDVESTIRIVQAGSGLAEGAVNCHPACDQSPPNAGRSEDLDALGTFMRTLRTDRTSGPLSPPAVRGQRLFHSREAACASCHPAPLFTDRQKHDVGTGRESPFERKGTSFDTPSLRFLASTAPYLHDGSAATLRDVLRSKNPDHLHGVTSHLTEAEIDDLVAFLESIPLDPPPRRRSARR